MIMVKGLLDEIVQDMLETEPELDDNQGTPNMIMKQEYKQETQMITNVMVY